MRTAAVRPWLVLALLFCVSVVAACTSSTSPQPVPTGGGCTACVTLQGTLRPTVLPSVGAIGVTATFAGSGVIVIADSSKPMSIRAPFALLDSVPAIGRALFYMKFTAYNGSATLTYVPGVKLALPGVLDGRPTIRTAALLDGVWTTVGKPGDIDGRTVTFPPVHVSPPIHLDDGTSYRMGIYQGGILPPTPTPTPSPTPGAMTVRVTCNESGDTCVNGTTKTAGSVQFYALGDTAALEPSESGKGLTFTLSSDTCNTTDDPSAGGNWATFSPGIGHTGKSFTVTAQNGGTSGNPSQCTAVLKDNHHQRVTIDIGVTPSNVGVH